MSADMLIFFLALCFICVSSNETYLENSEQNSDACAKYTLSAPLGSSVLLPCNFAPSNLNWVSWAHPPGKDLVRLTSRGRIKFLDHRYGRVKVFPNQGSEGNYSICIDELNNSDLGVYRCKQGHECLQVELAAEREPYLENSEQDSDVCQTHTLSAPLGSSVLLPCTFTSRYLNLVSWAHPPGMDLVRLTSRGHIKFLDHRYGRVKVFPNQGSEGNYSICIDELNNSDLGFYRCKQGHECLQVELAAERACHAGGLSDEMRLLIFICVGVAAFFLLSVGGYCCLKCISCCNKRTQDQTNNPEGAGTEGASVPPEETGSAPVDQQQRGAGNDNLVYENDDQDPSIQQGDTSRRYCNMLTGVLPDPDWSQPTQSTSGINPNLNQFERTQSQRTKQRFHRELFSRLRQASFSRHYYVNRDEINMQQGIDVRVENQRRAGFGKKKAKENAEYKNPIYNRSTDQLNHL